MVASGRYCVKYHGWVGCKMNVDGSFKENPGPSGMEVVNDQ